MKNAYRMFKRKKSEIYYLENNETKVQFSLKTKDRQAAEKLLRAYNEKDSQPSLNRELGRVYLRASDARMADRTWAEAMAMMIQRGKESTQARCKREMESKAFAYRALPLLCCGWN